MSAIEAAYKSVTNNNDDTDTFEVPGGQLDIGLGTEEYRQFKQQVESKRRLVKSEYAHVKRKVTTMRETLLDRYDKLWTLVEKREARDIERKKHCAGDKNALKQQRAKEVDYASRLLEEVTKHEEDLMVLEADLEMKHNYLATFLSENGKMYSAVEKAEALDTELRRKVQRKAAHDQILDAIQGCILIDIPDSMDFSTRRDKERENKELRDKYAGLHEELKALRENEEVTDQLVDRLKNKVEAIDLMEESQVEMIDSQLIKQRKLGLKIRELKQKVDRNNEELNAISDKVKSDISQELHNLVPPVLQTALFGTICIVITCLSVVVIASIASGV
eukprot:TRINITY_DN682_c0_g1_i1.p1 TRINITY_DN682_c0_g1~~TRINITY_DN682_c0_g1_i1.p1  ORF type:complete len:333 (+),score=99.11 TRINITY_DN682_c0_g1_i1:77-1075(+)